MKDHHPHMIDVVQPIEHLDASERVAHHLWIMVGTDLDAFAMLVVHDADGLTRNDERVSSAEALRHKR